MRAITKAELLERQALIDQAIEQHVVFAATKSWCPHSRKAKDLLASLSVEAKIIDIDLLDNAEAVQEYLKEKSGGQKTVPNM